MRRMSARGVGWVLGVVAVNWVASAARAQGIIVDRRPQIPVARAYEVREVSVDARVRDQVAEVQVSQTFHNPGSIQLEAEYLFPLPEDGAIQNFVLMVDGRELPGRLLPKDEARRIYEEIVRTKRDPALLEYMGRGLFRTSVFPIPPGADRKVTLRYTQLCKRDRDVVEFAYPARAPRRFTAKPIQRLTLEPPDREPGPDQVGLLPERRRSTIDRPGEREVKVDARAARRRARRTTSGWSTPWPKGPLGATVLSYRPDASRGRLLPAPGQPRGQAARRQAAAQDGRLRARPLGLDGRQEDRPGQERPPVRPQQPPRRRHLQHRRLRRPRRDLQARAAALLVRASRDEAERFVDNIREGGSTNIDAALKAALAMIPDDSRPNYVLFLTDGLPTAARPTSCRSPRTAARPNKHRARVFSFGVGFDVNARLLDRLSGGNSGTSEYVRPDEDIESHVGRVLLQDDQPGPRRDPPRAGRDRRQPDLSPRHPRPLRGRPARLGRPLPAVGHGRRSGSRGKVGGERRVVRVPRRAGRAPARAPATTSSRGSGPSAGSASSSTRSTSTARTRS